MNRNDARLHEPVPCGQRVLIATGLCWVAVVLGLANQPQRNRVQGPASAFFNGYCGSVGANCVKLEIEDPADVGINDCKIVEDPSACCETYGVYADVRQWRGGKPDPLYGDGLEATGCLGVGKPESVGCDLEDCGTVPMMATVSSDIPCD